LLGDSSHPLHDHFRLHEHLPKTKQSASSIHPFFRMDVQSLHTSFVRVATLGQEATVPYFSRVW
jgi:hypothetical protein